ncbi:MAG: hypothetical protein AB7N76_00240 [Planctomycetota bacterium]
MLVLVLVIVDGVVLGLRIRRRDVITPGTSSTSTPVTSRIDRAPLT